MDVTGSVESALRDFGDVPAGHDPCSYCGGSRRVVLMHPADRDGIPASDRVTRDGATVRFLGVPLTAAGRVRRGHPQVIRCGYCNEWGM